MAFCEVLLWLEVKEWYHLPSVWVTAENVCLYKEPPYISKLRVKVKLHVCSVTGCKPPALEKKTPYVTSPNMVPATFTHLRVRCKKVTHSGTCSSEARHTPVTRTVLPRAVAPWGDSTGAYTHMPYASTFYKELNWLNLEIKQQDMRRKG